MQRTCNVALLKTATAFGRHEWSNTDALWRWTIKDNIDSLTQMTFPIPFNTKIGHKLQDGCRRQSIHIDAFATPYLDPLWPWPLIFDLQNLRRSSLGLVAIPCKFQRECSSSSWDMVCTRLDLDDLLWPWPLTSRI